MSATSWSTRRVKALADIRVSNVDKKSVEGEPAVRLCNYTDVYYRDRIDDSVDFMAATAPASQARAFRLQVGDVLITKDSESWDDIAVPAVVAAPVDAVCGYHLALLRPKPDKANGRFLAYSIYAGPAAAHFKVEANGVTRFAIGLRAIGDAPVRVPSLNKQVAIADYLDSETARIDSLVDRKQRFIDLLLEKRTALITHAVTKGLDPDVEMKDWQLVYRQQVPAHWELLRAKYILTERDVRSFDGSEELLTVSHITGVTPRSEKKVYMFMAETNEGYKTCRRGDLAINTMWAYQGAAGIAPCDGIVSPSYNVYSFSRAVDPEYYDMLVRIRPTIAEFESRSTGIWKSRLRLYPSEFLDIWLPVPPIDEQRVIVAAVNARVGDTDVLVNKTFTSIELLKEYRTALISAAVAGQIDIPATDTGEDVA